MMIKSNHNLSKHTSTSTQECRLYVLVALVIITQAIIIFISLLTMTMNLTLIDHASAQKTSQTLNQKFEAEVYFST